MPLPDIAAALAWLSVQRPAMEALLERLVRQNSFTRNPTGVNAVVSALAAELSRLGLEVERIPSGRFGDHLFFRTPAAGRPAFLIGHTDTVFAPGTFEGYALEGDLARGPGAYDMKGGLVVALFALQALERAGLLGRVPLRGLFVSDEEVSSPESQPILKEKAAGAACALGLESGRDADLVITARKGLAGLEATAHGVAAHAGNDHQKGRSAVRALARFVERVEALTDHGRGVTLNVGRFEGGTTRNTVPASARCEIDLRFPSAADGERVLEAVGRAAAEAALPGTRIEIARRSGRPPLERTHASAALAAEYGACQAESGLGSGEAPLAGGGSDAATTAAAGIPSIDGLGPRGAAFHTPDERVDLASLAPKAAALVRFLARRAP
jgi:glutamate carboxypeptidase